MFAAQVVDNRRSDVKYAELMGFMKLRYSDKVLNPT